MYVNRSASSWVTGMHGTDVLANSGMGVVGVPDQWQQNTDLQSWKGLHSMEMCRTRIDRMQFEGFGELGGSRWEGNKTTNNADSGALTLLGKLKACPPHAGCVQLAVLSACGRQHGRDKWKAAMHARVLESEHASQAGMLSGHAQRVPGVGQVGRRAHGEQLQSRAACAVYIGTSPCTGDVVQGTEQVQRWQCGDIHAQKAIEENRHGDEKSGQLEGTSGSA
ncbi:hypothetical protein B0H10DRAFT_1948849 [Mycena sp. CBHHK59/15]|nr:hypothetical protein B0H10DRAFT_1948849 [Mycena sp. CBHHK59/15]